MSEPKVERKLDLKIKRFLIGVVDGNFLDFPIALKLNLQFILIAFQSKFFSDFCKFFLHLFFAESETDCLRPLLSKELATIVSKGIVVLSYTTASNEEHTEQVKVKYSPKTKVVWTHIAKRCSRAILTIGS